MSKQWQSENLISRGDDGLAGVGISLGSVLCDEWMAGGGSLGLRLLEFVQAEFPK